MQSTMLVLEFGKAQSILQTERNLCEENPGSAPRHQQYHLEALGYSGKYLDQ